MRINNLEFEYFVLTTRVPLYIAEAWATATSPTVFVPASTSKVAPEIFPMVLSPAPFIVTVPVVWIATALIVPDGHHLIGTAEHEGDVPPEQVTLSIFRAKPNKTLFADRNFKAPGTQRSGLWRIMRMKPMLEHTLHELGDIADETLREYGAIVLDLIAKKNPALFAEVIRSDDMKYAGLMEAFKKVVLLHDA